MFKKARMKLTAWYLVIIMLVSIFFSLVIYAGINRELTRIEYMQKVRVQRLHNLGFPTESEPTIPEIRARIVATLGIVNFSIFVMSGLAGYFLAGKTLEPIEEMLEAQKEFVSNASHELRTPLTSLKTGIEVGLREKAIKSKEARQILESNLEEVNKMQKLANDLLTLNKYQSRVTNIPFKKVDLGEIAEKSIKGMQVLAKTKKIKIIQKLVKANTVGNEESLGELVTILLDNAIKYSPEGAKVIVRTKKQKDTVLLEVEDFGPGINKKDISHIFDRFYRGKASEKKDGYGLGLSIAKSIVDLHKGKIEVKSKGNKGTIFQLLLRIDI